MIIRLLSSMLALFSLGNIGCGDFKAWYATEFRQGEVTTGIVRLSAQHLSMMTSELGRQFKGANVATKIVPSDDPLEIGKGTVLRTLENLDLNFPLEQKVHEDCLGTTATWRGKVEVVKATQTIYGRLTNNPENPVIPDPNRIKMTVHVKPHSSIIRFSDKPDHVKFDSGEIIFDAYPRLGQAQAGALKSLRVIPTSNTRYENVMFKNIKGTLVSEKVTLPFNIFKSNIVMQLGKGENGEENRLEGEITAFGNTRKIPEDGHDLNPNYDSLAFMQSYSCNENFNGIVEYNNVLFEEKIGPGIAGLTSLVMGKIASKLSDDMDCGMASVAYLRKTEVSSEAMQVGESRGSLPAPCKITFMNFRTEPDCFGVLHEINGEAYVISASKNMKGLVLMAQKDFNDSIDSYEKGIRAGTPDILKAKPEPVIPKSRQPAEIEMTADLSELSITEVCVNQGSINHDAHCNNREDKNAALKFSIHKGRISAKLKPMMGKSTDPNDDKQHMCSVRLVPIAETEFQLFDVDASVAKAGNQFQALTSGAYRALNGKIDAHENELSGEVTVGKVTVPFKTNDKNYLPLKPDYDESKFADSFLSCAENRFIVPASDEDCSLRELGL